MKNDIAGKNDQIATLQPQLAAPKEKSLKERERQCLLKMIIGMAMKGYSYSPIATRSDTPKEISGDIALLGLSLDEDTVIR